MCDSLFRISLRLTVVIVGKVLVTPERNNEQDHCWRRFVSCERNSLPECIVLPNVAAHKSHNRIFFQVWTLQRLRPN